MRRSDAFKQLAVELDILAADAISDVMEQFRTSSPDQPFERWAVVRGLIPAEQAIRLVDAFHATRWRCMSCQTISSGKDFPGGRELKCPACGNPYFRRETDSGGARREPRQTRPFGQPPGESESDPDFVPAGAPLPPAATASNVHDTHTDDEDDPTDRTYVDAPASDEAIAATAHATGEDLKPGERIGNWEIVAVAGQGGMSTVYKARHPELNQFAAIKVLDENYLSSATQRLRFRDEARACAGLQHRGIVQVRDFGEIRGRIYIVMQWIEGVSLDQRLQKEGPLPADQVVRIGLEATEALETAHSAGIVHRDIKPDNVMQAFDDGHVTITDFGLAKSVNAQVGRTQPGYFVGTPSYMAPEQVNGEPVVPQTDIYSLGATMFHLLTGSKPFEGKTFAAVMHQHVAAPFPSAREKREDVPRALDELLRWMCAKQAENRPGSMAEVGTVLRGVQEEMAGGATASVPAPAPAEADGDAHEVTTFVITVSTPEVEQEMIGWLHRTLKRNGYDESFETRAEFVVAEVVEHARQQARAAGVPLRVQLDLMLTRDYLKIVAGHNGPGFDAEQSLAKLPGESRAGQIASGEQLPQIRELSDHLEFDEGGRRATIVLMRKRLNLTARQREVDEFAERIEVVEVNGNLDSRSQMHLTSLFDQLRKAGVRFIVVDMTGCEFCNSTALGTMLRVADDIAEHNNGLMVLCNLHPKVRGIFDMLGLPAFIHITASLDEALASIRQHGGHPA